MKFLVICILLIQGCATFKKSKGPEEIPAQTAGSRPPSPQKLDRTQGEFTLETDGALRFNFKSITGFVDPQTIPTNLPPLDYLFLTDATSRHFGESARQGLRKDLKIIAPPDAVADIQKSGFQNVKGLSAGARLQLKKDNGFLFVSCVQTKKKDTGKMVNGYFLEFDGGRNIFITGDIDDVDVLRTFLFELRDDGREVHMAFVYSNDVDKAAEIIALYQPKVAVVLQDPTSKTKMDATALSASLKTQLFDGSVFFPRPSESFPF